MIKVRNKCNEEYTLVNIYAPTKYNVNIQIQFLSKLEEMLENYKGDNLILGGDWNVILDNTLDKRGGNKAASNKYQIQLEKFIQICF